MFKRIFQYEIDFWLRQPSTYIYTGFFFFIALISMAGTAGAFDPHSDPDEFFTWINSPAMIYDVTRKFNTLILVLLPAIIGMSIFRDFKHNMHSILYAYPVKKFDYYIGKFTSAMLFSIIILIGMIVGLIGGELIPSIDPNKIGPTNWMGYAQVLFVYLIPNALLVGSIVFVVVTLSRNIYSGYIAAVIILLINFIISKVLGSMDNQYVGALLDPLGGQSLRYYLQYWTGAEINTSLLPIKGVVIINRLIWIGISILTLLYGYRRFEMEQESRNIPIFNSKTTSALSTNIRSTATQDITTSDIILHFSFNQNLKTTWSLAKSNYRYILSQRSFLVLLIVGLLVVVGALSIMSQQELTALQPVTWRMLEFPVFFFSGVINLLTFLFAGMLIHRSRMSNMDQLVDICPQPNWVFIVSDLVALLAMQLTVLFVIMISGMAFQLYNGFYDIRFGSAAFELFVLNFAHFSVYGFMAMFVQSVFKSPFLGLFVLIVLLFIFPQVHRIGLDHILFKYNAWDEELTGMKYSELSGFGVNVVRYLVYKLYWIIFGIFLILASSLLWIRGLPQSIKERVQLVSRRMNTKLAISMVAILAVFISFGYTVYFQEEIAYTKINSKEDQEAWSIKNERLLGAYRNTTQPIITAVKLDIDLFPAEKSFNANAILNFKNHTNKPIDTLIIYSGYDEVTSYAIDRPHTVITEAEALNARVLLLDESLSPNNSFQLSAHIQNEPNQWFHSSSGVTAGGTFFNNSIMPQLGYRNYDITSAKMREENGLSKIEEKPDYLLPYDTLARSTSISSFATPWIHLDATISTDVNESAITIGELTNQWTKDNRNYFNYKTTQKVKNRYAIQSGKYTITEDRWNDVDLYIYHHPDHTYNLDRIFKGAKAALEYGTKHYGEYPYTEIRIVEFPRTEGTYATLLANTIPFSETRFLADINDDDIDAIDMLFYVTAHEISHQWWGNNLNPANAKGAKLLTEGITEYSTLQILAEHYGELPVQKFLQFDLDAYLKGRAETNDDQALLYSDPSKDFINYRKGSIVLYALADYLGKDAFNERLRSFMQQIQYQESDFATSVDLINHIKPIIPDSLNYLIKDMFETITFNDIRMKDVEVTDMANGQYKVDLTFLVSKIRKDNKGKDLLLDDDPPLITFTDGEDTILSLPLNDYIEIGLFTGEGENKSKIYLKKHKITTIENKLSIIVDTKPTSAGADPLNKLIDMNIADNLVSVK